MSTTARSSGESQPGNAVPPSAKSPGLVTLRELMTTYAHALPVRRVAVVGNAPLDPDASRAEAIDAADLVIRVNSFVLDEPGTPPAQGSRVDVVVWNRITRATKFLFEDYPHRLYLMVEPMRMHGATEMWPQSWPADLGLVPVSNRDIAQPLNELLGYDWRAERLVPTTGLTAAYLALTLFGHEFGAEPGGADIMLTGFSFLDDPEQTSWRHQWGDESPVGSEHRIDRESQLMSSWVRDGHVSFMR